MRWEYFLKEDLNLEHVVVGQSYLVTDVIGHMDLEPGINGCMIGHLYLVPDVIGHMNLELGIYGHKYQEPFVIGHIYLEPGVIGHMYLEPIFSRILPRRLWHSLFSWPTIQQSLSALCVFFLGGWPQL